MNEESLQCLYNPERLKRRQWKVSFFSLTNFAISSKSKKLNKSLFAMS